MSLVFLQSFPLNCVTKEKNTSDVIRKTFILSRSRKLSTIFENQGQVNACLKNSRLGYRKTEFLVLSHGLRPFKKRGWEHIQTRVKWKLQCRPVFFIIFLKRRSNKESLFHSKSHLSRGWNFEKLFYNMEPNYIWDFISAVLIINVVKLVFYSKKLAFCSITINRKCNF
jgi:hypothetical protein